MKKAEETSRGMKQTNKQKKRAEELINKCKQKRTNGGTNVLRTNGCTNMYD